MQLISSVGEILDHRVMSITFIEYYLTNSSVSNDLHLFSNIFIKLKDKVSLWMISSHEELKYTIKMSRDKLNSGKKILLKL